MKTKQITKQGRGIALFFSILFLLFSSHASFSQGCVAVRHMSTCSSMGDTVQARKHWQLALGYRWLRSNRHFRGSHEEAERKEQNTEVINIGHSLDISLGYYLTPRLSLTLAAPVSYTDRSSLYEHDRKKRYHTQSYGLGDIRLTANYWLWSPEKYFKRNVSFGLGVKAPTGNYRVKDEFHTANGIEEKYVDQSIQLGDGGWGAVLETQGYSFLFRNASLYFNGFYLINPRNTNGTPTGRRDNLAVGSIISVMSVCDQYMARLGLSYKLGKTGLYGSLGGRIDGIPVWDLIGDSDGFRRPGYAINVEPGLSYTKGSNYFSLSVPVAVYRNRPKSVSDIRTNGAGGDAAFADFFVLANYGFRF